MTRYEDVKDNLFEQRIDHFLIEWLESWIAAGGSEQGFATEVLRRVNRANQIRKGKRPVETMGTPLPEVSGGQSSISPEGYLHDSPRDDNEQGLGLSAERLRGTFPAQPENGLDHVSHSSNGQQAFIQPVPPCEPSELQRAIARKVAQAAAKTVFETYRFANGTALGEIWLHDLAKYEQKSSADAFVARQIRLAFKGHANCKIKTLSLAKVESIVRRADEAKCTDEAA